MATATVMTLGAVLNGSGGAGEKGEKAKDPKANSTSTSPVTAGENSTASTRLPTPPSELSPSRRDEFVGSPAEEIVDLKGVPHGLLGGTKDNSNNTAIPSFPGRRATTGSDSAPEPSPTASHYKYSHSRASSSSLFSSATPHSSAHSRNPSLSTSGGSYYEPHPLDTSFGPPSSSYHNFLLGTLDSDRKMAEMVKEQDDLPEPTFKLERDVPAATSTAKDDMPISRRRAVLPAIEHLSSNFTGAGDATGDRADSPTDKFLARSLPVGMAQYASNRRDVQLYGLDQDIIASALQRFDNLEQLQKDLDIFGKRECAFMVNCDLYPPPAEPKWRKGMSHFFGRNKTMTRKVADDVWIWFCRKHYQRARYRNANDYVRLQIRMIEAQALRIEVWSLENIRKREPQKGVLKDWTVLPRRRERQRVEDEKEARRGDLQDDSASEVDSSDDVSKLKDGPQMPEWLHAMCGPSKSTAEVQEIIARIHDHVYSHDNVCYLPDIEFLPNIEGSEAGNPVKRDKKKNAVKPAVARRTKKRNSTDDDEDAPPSPIKRYRPNTVQFSRDLPSRPLPQTMSNMQTMQGRYPPQHARPIYDYGSVQPGPLPAPRTPYYPEATLGGAGGAGGNGSGGGYPDYRAKGPRHRASASVSDATHWPAPAPNTWQPSFAAGPGPTYTTSASNTWYDPSRMMQPQPQQQPGAPLTRDYTRPADPTNAAYEATQYGLNGYFDAGYRDPGSQQGRHPQAQGQPQPQPQQTAPGTGFYNTNPGAGPGMYPSPAHHTAHPAPHHQHHQQHPAVGTVKHVRHRSYPVDPSHQIQMPMESAMGGYGRMPAPAPIPERYEPVYYQPQPQVGTAGGVGGGVGGGYEQGGGELRYAPQQQTAPQQYGGGGNGNGGGNGGGGHGGVGGVEGFARGGGEGVEVGGGAEGSAGAEGYAYPAPRRH